MGENIEGFDWDEHNVAHIARHRVRPEEVEQVFANGAAPLKVADVRGERRFYDVGETDAARLLYVVWTRRRELRRVITCWPVGRNRKNLRAAWYGAEKERFKQ